MVKIVDLTDYNDELPFDVKDDMFFHMLNDNAFYRRQYLPTVVKMKKGNPDEILSPMIDRCSRHYCEKYKINKDPNELLTDADKADLITKICEYESDASKE